MRSPRDAIELVQIVGKDAKVGEPPAKFRQHVNVVVDAAHEHSLVKDGHAGIDEPSQRVGGGVVDLGRMVAMDDHERRQPRAAQPCRAARR